MSPPGVRPLHVGPFVVVLSCALGFAAGGFADDALVGSNRVFGLFGAAFGASVGGLIAGALTEFALPLVSSALSVQRHTPSETPGRLSLESYPLRLNLAGRVLQGVSVAATIIGGASFAMEEADFLAALLGMSAVTVAVLLAIATLLATVLVFVAASALARHLDLTVP